MNNLHVKLAIEMIEQHYSEPLNLERVSNTLHIHPCYFCNLFKENTKMTFIQYLNQIRIKKSLSLLLETQMSILEIGLAVGFENHSTYTMAFKKEFGLTPKGYRKKHRE